MKKHFPLLFILLQTTAFCQTKDSAVFPYLSVKIDPIMLFWEAGASGYVEPSFGAIFEYSYQKNRSAELGGEYVNNLGYTIRGGIRFYNSKRSFLGLHFFYRNWNYKNRGYYWNRDSELSEIKETTYLHTFSGTDCWYRDSADEHKEVFCAQILYGKQYLTKKCFYSEVYIGLGIRYKYRVKEIYYHYANCGSVTYYSPPIEKVSYVVLPSLQFGIVIGFRLKKQQIIQQ